MEEQKIDCIYLSALNEGNDVYFDQVGKNGITKIEKVSYSPEPFCGKFYFNVYKDGVLWVERHAVTTVIYKLV